ncbi:hypothetical protein SEVIR_6G000400v4 [Setaria viridis]|uniref:Uncharacterized protein n=1 Tax=Setaria viridis TaxID=4556 RepID=A0A4U6U1T4_SETVI|nr:hypothetical protein SEVIR_6G000400v2 [Setaria viridis]TKW08004.1 hypothetical protein SEVIR_6G000400v2 [Setaria viridis]
MHLLSCGSHLCGSPSSPPSRPLAAPVGPTTSPASLVPPAPAWHCSAPPCITGWRKFDLYNIISRISSTHRSLAFDSPSISSGGGGGAEWIMSPLRPTVHLSPVPC